MADQVYFEDVTVGMEIPPLERGVLGIRDVIRFDAAVENYERLHQDYKWCIENGYPDVIFNGPIKNALLATMLTNWIGEGGWLKKLGCQHRGMDVPGNSLTATGQVTKTYEEDGMGFVELDVKVTNQNGEVTCPGTAVVILPLRGGKTIPTVFPEPAAASA
jgi:acyl dehydratase